MRELDDTDRAVIVKLLNRVRRRILRNSDLHICDSLFRGLRNARERTSAIYIIKWVTAMLGPYASLRAWREMRGFDGDESRARLAWISWMILQIEAESRVKRK